MKASIDWAKDGNFTGTFDNVTSRLSPTARVVVEYGRDVVTPMAPVTSGSGSLTLLNGDRRYSPRNAASPLFGLIKPARPFKLERTISLPSPTTYTLGPRMHTDSQALNPDRDAKTAGVRLVDYMADLRGKSLSTAVFQGLQKRTPGFAIMLAVTEAAAPEQVVEFDEARFHVIAADMAEAEFANAWGVDQLTATGKVEKPCGGGGVRPLAGQLRQRADTRIDAGQQAVDQG